jgi:hypothetical protein
VLKIHPIYNTEATFFEKKVVFTYLFLILPIFDMLNGFLVVGGYISAGGIASPSQLGRLIATCMLLIIAYRHRLNVVWGVVVIYPICVEVLSGFLHQNDFGFIYGVISSYKLIYLFLMCIVFCFFCKKAEDMRLLGAFLKANLLLISFSLVFSLLTGLGNDTYGYGFGTKGFFASGNGIGVYMGICSLIMLGLKRYGLYDNIRTSTLVFFAVSTAIIGSKTAFFLSMVMFFLIIWNSKYRYLAITFFTVIFIILLPKVIDVLGVVFDIVVKRYELAENFILFIGSGRIGYVEHAFQVFLEQRDIAIRLVFGSGAFLSFQDPSYVSTFDTLETDIFDVLFMYGIIGVFVYLFAFSRLIVLLSKTSVFLLAVSLLFLHSLVAGHVLFNGLSTFVIAILSVVANYLKQKKENTYV